MCGILGIISNDNIVEALAFGLERLEYRGYDSSGIAIINKNKLKRIRNIGKVELTIEEVKSKNLFSTIGIGHTRWATHGGVSKINAHPHFSNDLIAIVHNGIIENYHLLKQELLALGYSFSSETDTEVIAHYIHYFYLKEKNLFKAVSIVTSKLKGAYALCVISADDEKSMVVASMGCPLVLGLCNDKILASSDVFAIIPHTNKIIYLEENDISLLRGNHIEKIIDTNKKLVNRKVNISNLSLSSIDLGPYKHYMQKEIFEQPRAIADTLEIVFNEGFNPNIFGDGAVKIFDNIDEIKIIACGTSYYSGLIAKNWLENIAKIPTDVEIASEYRYRCSIYNRKQLFIVISQSGETLDTIEALKHARKQGDIYSLSICNVIDSALSRITNLQFFTRAGPEICVASTKAFTTQLTALFVLCVTLAIHKKRINQDKVNQYLEELRYLPGHLQFALNQEKMISKWAKVFVTRNHALFLGRGLHYPIALEGALKLKEITYIHAEGYPAGELKHGPLALVDKTMPVVVIAPNDELLDKVKSNMQEVKARGGELFVFADGDIDDLLLDESINIIKLPKNIGILSPIIYSIPVQLLAYHTAIIKGTNVDRPRNLAKSVTVE